MLSLKSFLESIQGAVLSANEALNERNLEVLNQYFDGGQEQDTTTPAASVRKLTRLTKRMDEVKKPSIRDIRKMSTDLKSVIKEMEKGKEEAPPEALTPKSVTINYPVKREDGTMDTKPISVPLITLVPLNFTQVEELKIQANIEFEEDDQNNIQIKFAGNTNTDSTKDDTPQTSRVGNIELVLKPHQKTTGMSELIESYEKVLKSQLPS